MLIVSSWLHLPALLVKKGRILAFLFGLCPVADVWSAWLVSQPMSIFIPPKAETRFLFPACEAISNAEHPNL